MDGKRFGFVFYEHWWSAIVNLPRDVQGDVLTAIIKYGLYGETTEQLKPIAKAMLEMVKPQIKIVNAENCPKSNGDVDGKLARQIEEYKHNQPIWKESIQMKFGISGEQIDKLLDEFYLDVRCKEIDVHKIASFFVGWLNRKQYEKDRRNNEAGGWSGHNGVKCKGAVDFDCGLVLPTDS